MPKAKPPAPRKIRFNANKPPYTLTGEVINETAKEATITLTLGDEVIYHEVALDVLPLFFERFEVLETSEVSND